MDLNIPGIYKIQSKIKPDRIYIGSAVNIRARWKSHLSVLRSNKHHNKKLQAHYNKYGEEDLCFSVIISCDKEDLIKNEQFYIDAYNSSFNLAPKAGNMLGFRHSSASKLKLSAIKIGNKNASGKRTEEVKLKMRKPRSEEFKLKCKGHIPSIEAKRKMSISHTGKPGYWTGKKRSPVSKETREKLRITRLGRKLSEESKQKCRDAKLKEKNAMYGKPVSIERRMKQSRSMLGKNTWMKGRKASQETLQKRKETLLKKKQRA